MFNYSGPMLWMAQIFHDAGTPSAKLLAAIDEVVGAAAHRRRSTRPRSSGRSSRCARASTASLESFAGFGRANLLASFALFDDDPSRINRLEAEFAKVTPALVQETAREYLRPGNRTVYTIEPGKAAPAKGGAR